MRALGRRMASGSPRAAGEARERVRAAVRLLADLGSAVDVAETDGGWTLSSDSCPIGEAVSVDARSCLSIAALIQEATGLEVTESCQHGERPRCRFEVGRGPPGAGGLPAGQRGADRTRR